MQKLTSSLLSTTKRKRAKEKLHGEITLHPTGSHGWTVEWSCCSKPSATAVRFYVFCVPVNRSDHYQDQNSLNIMLGKFLFSFISEVLKLILIWDYVNRF